MVSATCENNIKQKSPWTPYDCMCKKHKTKIPENTFACANERKKL